MNKTAQHQTWNCAYCLFWRSPFETFSNASVLLSKAYHSIMLAPQEWKKGFFTRALLERYQSTTYILSTLGCGRLLLICPASLAEKSYPASIVLHSMHYLLKISCFLSFYMQSCCETCANILMNSSHWFVDEFGTNWMEIGPSSALLFYEHSLIVTIDGADEWH